MAGVRHRVAALLWLRWRLAVNGLRTATGIVGAIVLVLVLLVGLLISVGLAAATFGTLYVLRSAGGMGPMADHAVVFAGIGLAALLLPWLMGELKLELGAARLLVFPVSRRELYWIDLGAGFLSLGNIVLYPCLLVVIGFGLTTEGVSPVGVVVGTVTLGMSLVIWQQLVVSFVRALFRSRRIREIVVVVGLTVVLGVSLVPSALTGLEWGWTSGGMGGSTVSAVLSAGVGVAPPMLAARVVAAEPASAAPVAGLLLWSVVGVWLGWYVFRWQLHRGTSGGTARVRDRRSPRQSWVETITGPLTPAVGGIAAKQLRYIVRSTTGRMNLVIAPLMAIALGFAFTRTGLSIAELSPAELGFVLLCCLAASFGNNFGYNLFMWDGDGAPLYFLAPAEPSRVLLGLHTGLWIFQAAVLLLVVVGWTLAVAVPSPSVLCVGLLLGSGLSVVSTALGAVSSTLLPVRRDISAAQSSPAYVASLVSLMAIPAFAIVFGGVPVLLLASGHRAAAVAAAAAGVVVVAALYRLALPSLGRLLTRRREALLGALRGQAA